MSKSNKQRLYIYLHILIIIGALALVIGDHFIEKCTNRGIEKERRKWLM